MPFQMSLKNDLTELHALSHADLIELVTLEMVEETALMAPETSDLIPFQMFQKWTPILLNRKVHIIAFLFHLRFITM